MPNAFQWLTGAERRAPSRSAKAALPGGARLSDEGSASAIAFLDTTTQRLHDLLDAEIAALRSRKPVDLNEYNNGKSQALFDLSRAMRLLDGVAVDASLRKRLEELRAKLELNGNVLRMHMEAVREISTIVSDAIQAAESDGTYSVAIRAGGNVQ